MALREPALAGVRWSRDFYRALGRAIKVARTELGLERKELARRSGISYAYLSDIEKGSKRPSTEVLLPIALVLGLKQSELLQRAEGLLEHGMSPGLSGRSRPGRTRVRHAMARVYRLEALPAESASEAQLQELVSRVGHLGVDDFNRVLDLARRLAR